MSLKTTRWEYLRAEEFDEMIQVAKGVCVIPMGCLEKHGPHLPVGQDIMQASAIARKAAELEPVCIFPDFVFGDVQGLTMFKGSVILSPELLFGLLDELCAEIARNGFKKIIIHNAHGGNVPLLQHFMRCLAYKKRDYVVVCLLHTLIQAKDLQGIIQERGREAVPELNEEDLAVLRDFVEQNKTEGHGGLTEAAIMQGIRPELVRMDRLGSESGLSTGKADHLNRVGITMKDSGWGINFPNSYAGHDPIGSSERLGRCMIRLAAERAAGQYKIIKEDQDLLRWNDEFNAAW